MATDLEIRGEDDLFDAINKAKSGQWTDDTDVKFVGWPVYEITIRGERFDGGVPTRIMPALIELQKAINSIYSRNIHGTKKRLSEEDYRKVELVVRVKHGSTSFETNLASAFNHAIGNMTGTETLVGFLVAAALWTGAYVWKSYINGKAKIKMIDFQTTMTQEETRRLQLVTDMAKEFSSIRETMDEVREVQDQVLKRLNPDDELVLGGETLVNGETGRLLVRQDRRKQRLHDRLDGNFIILSVDSGRLSSGFRASVRNTETGDELKVSIPEGTLNAGQLDSLKNGEWSKRPLRMEINVELFGDQIVKATLKHAGLSGGRAN